MAVLHSVLDVALGDTPTRVTGVRKVGLYGAEPFRKSAEVGGLGAKDLAPMLVQNLSHISRSSDSGVDVRVEHRSKRVGGAWEKFVEASGKLLLPVAENSSRTMLFLTVEVFHLVKRLLEASSTA